MIEQQLCFSLCENEFAAKSKTCELVKGILEEMLISSSSNFYSEEGGKRFLIFTKTPVG